MVARKEIVEPSKDATYLEVRNYYTYTEFNKRFKGQLSRALTDMYGEELQESIMEEIDNKVLSITNPALFFISPLSVQDPSHLDYYITNNLERYLREVVLAVKRLEENGAKEIVLTDFMFTLADIIGNMEKSKTLPNIHELLDWFILSLTHVGTAKKFKINIKIRVLDKYLVEIIKGVKGYNVDRYYDAYKLLLNALNNLHRTKQCALLRHPKVTLVHAVYTDYTDRRDRRIAEALDITTEEVRKALIGVSPFDADSHELVTRLEYLVEKTGKDVDLKELIASFSVFKLDRYFKTYGYGDTLKHHYGSFGVDSRTEKKYDIRNAFTNAELFRTSSATPFSEVVIDCGKLELIWSKLEYLVDYAHKINVLRSRLVKTKDKKAALKITLVNFKRATCSLLEDLLEKRKELMSQCGKEVVIEVMYDSVVNVKRAPKSNSNYIRVVSDTHVDVNKDMGYEYTFGDDFVVCCGDVSGGAITSSNWIKNNIKRGVFVHGNHLGYNASEGTLNEQIKYLEDNFSGLNEVQYLNNKCYEYEGIIFIGTCLYTDFKLYSEAKKETYMEYARHSMNDFRYIRVNDKNGDRKLTPDDYCKFHEEATAFLYNTTAKYPNKPVVILTHHAPLPFSIAEEYKGSSLNPAFASDMRDLIKARDNIRLWVHGHCHSPFDYVYRDTRVVCNPFGYYNENNIASANIYGLRISLSDIRDKEKWRKVIQGRLLSKKTKRYEDKDL